MAYTNRELVIQRINAEIEEAKGIVDEAIVEVEHLAEEMPFVTLPSQVRDGQGRLMMADLIATKAQLILAEVMLLKEN